MTITSSSLLQKISQLRSIVIHEPRRKWRDVAHGLLDDIVEVSFQPAYIEITLADGISGQTIEEDTPQNFNQYTVIEHSKTFDTGSVNLATGEITIPIRGMYNIDFHASYTTNIPTSEFWKICVVVNDSIVDGECTKTTQGSGKDQYNSTLGGLHDFNEGDVVAVNLSASAGPAFLSASFANFTLFRING